MRTYVGKEFGRYVILHLGKGELVLESIQAEISRLGIRTGGVTSGIGSARKIVYHRIADVEDSPTNEFVTVEKPIEIGSIQGLIIDGEPHLHIMCCSKDESFAGHLEPGCEIQYLAEIMILELTDVDLVRRFDKYKISYIDQR
jgi:uncharacterized protein